MLFRSDRKSTRLNSSHTIISYAVFCLKKKNKTTRTDPHAVGQVMLSRLMVLCFRHPPKYQLHTIALPAASRALTRGFCFFFFNDTATTEIYTLSLHDALPI